MMKLYYASGYVLIGDEMCNAVVEYAQALADVGRSDLVLIPAMSDDGTRGTARLLIGPASQLFAAPVKDLGVDLEDESTSAAIRRRLARLRPARPMYFMDEDEIDHAQHDGHNGY